MVEAAELLATKLHVPRPRPGYVPRARLVDRLDQGLAFGLILACAPAGFGKTALLADWVRRGERPVAWLSLDAGDNDPARFWRHATAAVDRLRPGTAERIVPLLGPPPPPSFDGLVTALINELAAEPGEVLLVLDDYHVIEAQPVHTSLMFLLENLPPALHVVVASRADPPLPLARLRARGQLAELRADSLRFTTDEAAALLRAAAGPEVLLPEDAVAALTARTEGWAAGLQLAALSLRGQSDFTGFVATFTGSHRYVLDYLTEEVLEHQTDQVRRFLLETSVLDRLSGVLCDAVTGRTDGQAMLEAIERANLFLVPLDEVRGWWRYHHLFADLLRARLHQQRPQRAVELQRNAAAWHDEHGLVNDAIRHALGAGDATWAAQLVERHADALLFRSEHETVQRWLSALPADVVGLRPRLLLARARLALLSGHLDAAENALDTAERALATATDEPYEPSVGGAASLLANVPATIAIDRAHLADLRGDADRAIAFATRAKAEIGEGQWMLRTHADGYLALAELLHGRLHDAERVLASAIARWRVAGERHLTVRGCYHLGQVQSAQGRLDAALGTYRQALEIAATPNRPVMPAAGMAHIGLAEVAYQRDELDTARRHLAAGIPLCRQLAFTQPLAMGLATLAWICQAQGDSAGASEAIDEADRVAPPTVADALNTVPAQRARLLLAQDAVAAADRWTQQRDLQADDDPSYAREGGYLVLARVLLAQDRPRQAIGLLERLHVAAQAQRRTASIIEIQALQALALAATGDETNALAALRDALTLGSRQGHIRIFVDEGQPMRTLLGKLIVAGRTAANVGMPRPYVDRLAHAFEDAGVAVGPDTRSGAAQQSALVAPLTGRESEVLALLAAGNTNKGIADQLVITLDTVKRHVTHIFDKLGVANRTQAAARARELGLQP